MALQDILKKIQTESEAQAAEVQQNLEKDKKEATKVASANREAQLELLGKKTESALEGVDQKIDTMARRENRQKLLTARRELLDQAMEKFYEALINADDSVKKSIFEAQAKNISGENLEIMAAKEDEKLIQNCFPQAKVTPSDKIKGGYTVKTGGMEIDNSFSNLVFSEYQEPLEMYFTDQLKLV